MGACTPMALSGGMLFSSVTAWDNLDLCRPCGKPEPRRSCPVERPGPKLTDQLPARCLTRRALVRAVVLSRLGLGLPSLLQADTQPNSRPPKSCIFIHQYGGLSQLDS